jgi:hypothetical protein
MIKNILFILFTFFSTIVNAQEKNSRVKITLSETTTMISLQELGLEVDHGEYIKNTSFESDLSPHDISVLKKNHIPYKIIIDDVSKFYADRNKQPAKKNEKKVRGGKCTGLQPDYITPAGFNYGSMGGYFTYQEAINKIDSLAILYPNIVTVKQAIGNYTTTEGKNIYWLKISDNPNTDEPEPEILYNSIHHAREACSLSQLIYYMYYLCENYNSNSHIKYLVDNIEMYFVPIVNPDGYLYNQTTNPNGGGMWRKNRRNNGGGTWGVDLNRNYGLGWGFNNSGSSPNANSDTYRGTSGFSEPETQAIRDFCNAHQFKFAVNYHTYSNLIVYPWGYLGKNCDDSLAYREFSSELTKYNAYKYGTDLETVGYSTTGSSDDWMYGDVISKPLIFAMTPEVGNSTDGFWPALNRILPLCEESNYMNITVAEFLLKYAKLRDVTPRLSNTMTNSIKYTITRLGLENPATFNVSITALSPFVSVTGAPKTYSALTLGVPQLDSISYTLSGSVPNNSELKFVLSVSNGINSHDDTVSVFYGNVQNIMNDNCTSFANWTNSGWALDNTQFYSSGSSFAENASGAYTGNQTKELSTASSINLTDALRAELNYKTKWELENSYDYVAISVSEDNGISWNVLCTPYTQITANTNLGTDVVYTGVVSDWVQEIVNLDAYIGKNILLQWLFKSDAGLNMQGFNMDDVVINKIVKTGLGTSAVYDENIHSIYPNPASDELNILLNSKEGNQMTIYSLEGKRCMSSNLTDMNTINISHLQNGIYWVEIQHNRSAKIERKKLIIAK